MTVLVTGATGTVGHDVVAHLVARDVPVRALTRSPEKAGFPAGVTPVGGELMDLEAMRAALSGVDGVFLLSPVAADELTGTLNTLDLIREAGIDNTVYLSVIHADTFTDPPHFAAKAAAERMIAQAGLSATILRPGLYMQTETQWPAALQNGIFSSPVGNKPVLATDTRDLAEVAARSLMHRLQAKNSIPSETLDVVAPEILSGDGIAEIWSEALHRPVSYGGDDPDAFEQQMRQFLPAWNAHDLRLMFQRFQSDGMSAAPGTDQRLRELLGRPMRSYREFAAETALSWTG